MSRYLITIRSDADREKASRWAAHAKEGMRVEFKEAKRSSEQNDKLWAMLTEVAAQVQWHGIKLTPEDFKFIFLDALKRELRVVPNIDGTGFVNLGRSSSDLSKSEMSDLIELIHAFGASHGVAFKDDSNSVEDQSPPAQPQPDSPAAVGESPLPDAAAGGSSHEETQVSDASPAGLPSGWEIRLRDALFRARKPESLISYAKQCFEQLGAVPTDQRDKDTAKAIRAVFEANFGNRAAIDDALRELV